MLGYNFKYEFKFLVRNKWIQVLFVILLGLVYFAGVNGTEKVEKRASDIQKAQEQLDEAKKVTVYDKTLAYLPIEPFAFTSIGQSDIYTPYLSLHMMQNDFELNHTELTSPVQLLFGSFDMAFIIVFLLPLIIIAFTYNTLSYEKERGSLKLLASQPISIYQWLIQKMLLRFFWVALIIILVLIITFILNGISIGDHMSQFLIYLGLIISYLLFWFAIAFVVNLVVGSSAKNAISLLGLWVIFVLLIPSTLNQIGNSIFPIPSRTNLINEMRVTKEEVKEKQDEVMDELLRDHPEYAKEGGMNRNAYLSLYLKSNKLVRDELKSLYESYEEQLEKQQNWIQKWRFVSPAIIMHQNLNHIAGTSGDQYKNFRKQALTYSGELRTFYESYIHKQDQLNETSVKLAPKFAYDASLDKDNSIFSILILLLFSIAIGFIGWLGYTKKKAKGNFIIN